MQTCLELAVGSLTCKTPNPEASDSYSKDQTQLNIRTPDPSGPLRIAMILDSH